MPRKAEDMPRNPTGKKRDDFEDFERVGGKDNRPRIPPPGKSGRESLSRLIKADAYTRASTLGETLERQDALKDWKVRMAIFGASRRRDLHLAIQAIPNTDGENKTKLDKLAQQCLDAAESDAGATIGIAFHALREQYDEGADLSHITGEAREVLDQWALLTAGFEILASEAKTVCDEHRVAGTFDVLLRLLWPMVTPDGEILPAGTVVVGDLKTSATSDYFGCKFAVQLAEYSHGTPFDVTSYGRISWAALGGTPHQRWALIIHIPTGNPKGAGLHWVNIGAGRELSELAITVRRQRGRKDLVVPAIPPVAPAQATKASLMVAILSCKDRTGLDAVWNEHRALWDEAHTITAKRHLADLARLASVGG